MFTEIWVEGEDPIATPEDGGLSVELSAPSPAAPAQAADGIAGGASSMTAALAAVERSMSAMMAPVTALSQPQPWWAGRQWDKNKARVQVCPGAGWLWYTTHCS